MACGDETLITDAGRQMPGSKKGHMMFLHSFGTKVHSKRIKSDVEVRKLTDREARGAELEL